MADTPSLQVPPQIRDLAQTNVEQARKAFDGLMGFMKQGVETLGNQSLPGSSSMQSMYTRGLEYTEQNVHAAFDHAQKLASAATPMEAMQLQAEFVRERFGAMQTQAQAFVGMAQNTMKQGSDAAGQMVKQGEDASRQVAHETQNAVDRSMS